MRVEDIILVSDMDGTIIPISGIISEKNIEAVKRFKQLGGTFTIATGRSPESAKQYLKLLSVDGIIVANNGATLYDIKNDKTVWSKCLELSYKEIVCKVMREFPRAEIQLITDDDKYYFASENSVTKGYGDINNINVEYLTPDKFPNNCCKVLFVVDNDIIPEFIDYCENQKQSFVNAVLVRSGGRCFEMMCDGISKGYPFERLVQSYGKTLDNSAAIGDYYNDVEMIEKASIGAAVENAVPEAKIVADIVVKSCENDGLADFIDYLIEK